MRLPHSTIETLIKTHITLFVIMNLLSIQMIFMVVYIQQKMFSLLKLQRSDGKVWLRHYVLHLIVLHE